MEFQRNVFRGQSQQTQPQVQNNNLSNQSFLDRNSLINSVQRRTSNRHFEQNYNNNNEDFNFKDDEKIIPKNLSEIKNSNGQAYDFEKNLIFSIKAKQKTIQLNSKQKQIIPCMVTIKSCDQQEKQQELQEEKKENAKDIQESTNIQNRPGIDIICVIDKSGSMQGEKIKLVIDTLKYMLTLLNENDRICLIQFENYSQRLNPLVVVNEQNIPKLTQTIDSLYADGGTNIFEAIKMAYHVIDQRQYINNVTSVFLLSDGLDDSADSRIKQFIANSKEIQFTINSFGFGKDHDPVLMNNIANYKQGNFYFIEKLENIDFCFVDALGDLMSVIGQNIKIRVKRTKHENEFKELQNIFKISYVYGTNWEKISDAEYQIDLSQLLKGKSKDFIFEMTVEPINVQLNDNQRNIDIFECSLELETLQNKQKIHKNANLAITIYNENEQLQQDINQDVDVLFNYYRVRGADIIKKTIQLADQNKNEEGEQLIQQMIDEIQIDNKVEKEKINYLMEDLKDAKESVKKSEYQSRGGQHKMQNIMNINYKQQSRGVEQDIFSNSIQTQLLRATKEKRRY